MNSPFHLAFPVKDTKETRSFFEGVLGCSIGSTSEKWIIFDFFGHQITAHLKPEEVRISSQNSVDGHGVPVSHFGAILDWSQWHELAERLKAINTEFLIEPYI